VGEAINLLNTLGDDAKLLAGGHSLLPMMKLRFAEPGALIDINRIPELRGTRRSHPHWGYDQRERADRIPAVAAAHSPAA